jgi:hypothetical protein
VSDFPSVLRLQTIGDRSSFGAAARPALAVAEPAHCPSSGKRRFPSRQTAEQYPAHLRAYRCESCWGWHLSSSGVTR